ncbi:MAG: hypothetical protein JWM34_4595 [Ilumatobacteraceae bacterium]|nr:hypothetical protein [Ilumatobacteraceae bacterium]
MISEPSITVPRRGARRAGALMTLVLLTGATACTSSNNGVTRTKADATTQSTPGTADSATSAAAPPSAPDTEPADTTADTSTSDSAAPPDVTPLSDAGIQIVSSEADAGNGAPLRLTTVQADRLAADTDPGAGMLGSELDALAPVPAGVPPASYLLAGWVSAGTSPAAATVRGWMGDQDWTMAPTIQFPLAAVAMFVNEMAANTSQLPAAPADTTGSADTTAATDATGSSDTTPATDAPATDSSTVGTPAGFVANRPAGPLDSPCSAVTGFLSSVIDGLFDALKVNPLTGGDGGFFDTATSVLAFAWDVALDLAKGAIEGLVKSLTAPIFNAIRTAVAALGAATVVVSYFKDQSLDVALETPQTSRDQYPFAVGAGADVTGKFVATGHALSDDWPAAIVDCAAVAGAKLPQLIKPGSPANWTVDGSVIVPGQLNGTVGADNTATLSFTTGRESDDDADGDPVYAYAYATVSIPRKEVEDFLRLAEAQINGVRAQLLGLVPKIAQPAVNNLLAQTVDPTIKEVSAEIAGSVGGPLAVKGTGYVLVLHHDPPDTTLPTEPSTPPSEPDDGGDFCAQYTDLFNWTAANQGADLTAFGAEVARRLTAMRPSAPDDLLPSVDAELDIYSALAAGAGPAELETKAQALATAAKVLGTYCGLG